MYPSDYGYATSGGGNTDRDACLNVGLYHWYDNDYATNCGKSNNWLYSSTPQWTLAPHSSSYVYVYSVDTTGHVENDGAYGTQAVRPSLYLKSDVKVVGGKGTSTEPYILKQES